MADNFNMKKFLVENKLGAYSKLKNEGEAAYEYEKGKAAGEKEEKAKLTKEGGDEDKLPLTPKMKKFIDKVISDAKKDGEFEELVQVDYFENDLIDFILEKFDDESEYDDVSQEVKDYINKSVKDYYRNPDGTPYFSEDLDKDRTDAEAEKMMDFLAEKDKKEEGYMGTQYDSSEDMAVDMVKKGITEKISPEAIERMEGLADEESLAKLTIAITLLGDDWMKEGFEKEDILEYLEHLLNTKLGEAKKPMKEGEDVFADIDDDIAYGTDSKEDAIEYLEDIIDYCQKKIVELENEQGYEEEDKLGEAVSQVTLPKGITLGSNNPEGDKLVLRFLQGIAKKFDYPVAKAAMFVKERLKKLGY